MTRIEFLLALQKQLSGLPREEIDEWLSFYNEIIDDRIEEGLTEEEAIRQIGPIENITDQIIGDVPMTKLVKERIRPRKRLTGWQITLLVLGSPLWLSLLIGAFAVVLSLYIVLWAVVICLWAAFASVAACSLAGFCCGTSFACRGYGLQGVAMLGAGFVLAGVSIFLFFGCKAATKGTVLLSKKIGIGIKKLFIKQKEEA